MLIDDINETITLDFEFWLSRPITITFNQYQKTMNTFIVSGPFRIKEKINERNHHRRNE